MLDNHCHIFSHPMNIRKKSAAVTTKTVITIRTMIKISTALINDSSRRQFTAFNIIDCTAYHVQQQGVIYPITNQIIAEIMNTGREGINNSQPPPKRPSPRTPPVRQLRPQSLVICRVLLQAGVVTVR